jgi:putative membrane protein
MKDRRNALILSTLVLLGLLAWSGWHPYDRPTWLLEVTPILVALPILWMTYQRFPLTTLLYACIFLHAIVLMVGGAYTYARVPMGFALQDWLHLERNPYDRIGHFLQGFVPALAAREILLRGKYINGKGMLAFLVICVVMTVSVTYEFIEWATALIFGQGAEEFLGTQGDPWDTQWDMFMALFGAVTALLLFTRFHDRQIARLK